jgi:Tol biopolymer transport system component
MPRIGDVLERESRTVDLEQGDFERLLGRREHKQRNRRIRAGAVGVIVALATGLVLVRALTSDRVPADRPVEPRPAPLELRGHVEVIERGAPGLVAVDLGTGESRTLVDGDEIQGTIGNAVWSGTGRWVAYDIHARQDSLWVVSPQSEPRQLAEDAGAWAWSPTDTQLAMMRTPSTLFPDTAEGRVPLSLFDASTGRRTDLGMTVGEVTTGPVWSPDGTRIAYGVRGGSIYSVDVEGGDHTLLVRLQGELDSIYGLEWSPDGAHVAILAEVAEVAEDQEARAERPDSRRLYVMNADASELPVLVDALEASGWGSFPGDPVTQIAWSPDGTRLTYATFSGPDDRELRIWTASLDGSAPSPVASHMNDECCIDGGSPVWSPDGSHIAFATDRANETVNAGYLAIDADGTDEPREMDELTYLSWRGGWFFCYCYG